MKISKVPLIRWWFTPMFPDVHVNRVLAFRPSRNRLINDRVRTWVIHPLKRRIARYYLLLLRRFGIKVVAITGSCGKTTTKDMVASILSQNGETVSSYKNIDPIFNIPTTILKAKPKTKYLVLEMGVEYPNEMDFYLWLAKPDIGVITNIYPTHMQNLKNLNGVLQEKGKLVRSLGKDGTAILNAEDKHLSRLAGTLHSKIMFYGKGSSIRALKRTIRKDMSNNCTLLINKSNKSVQLPVIGDQFISNSLAAAAVGLTLSLDLNKIIKGLEYYNPPEHRMRILRLRNDAIIIDDSYNNNPEAAKAAIQTLELVAGNRKRFIIFGDMLELGRREIEYHRMIGRSIAMKNFSYIIGVGNLSKYMIDEASRIIGKKYTFWAKDWRTALKIIKPHLRTNTITLIKGSRSVNLDRIVVCLSK